MPLQTQARLPAIWLLCAVACRAGASTPDEGIAEPSWLREILERHRTVYSLPALALSVVLDDRVAAASVVGVRRAGDKMPAQRGDRFHVASIAKTMTATMIARFVDQGLISWDDRIEQMFPLLAPDARPAYRGVTLRQLLTHTGGMPYQPRTPESETDKHGSTARLKRQGYVMAALKDPPAVKPATKLIYGGGHILAAHYVEQITGSPYEDLMRDQVFLPLAMTTARFGPPATPGKLDGLWEHSREKGITQAMKPARAAFVQARAPAGRNLCMSITDLGRFAAEHLRGAHRESAFLRPGTFSYLQTPLHGKRVAPGWFTGYPRWARGRVLHHSGSTGVNHALCHIVPEERFAVCVATNISFKGLHSRLNAITEEVARLVQDGKFDDL